MSGPSRKRTAASPSSAPAALLETADTHPLVDKFGRRHTIHVLTAWSPRALEAMGVRPINTDTKGEAPTR